MTLMDYPKWFCSCHSIFFSVTLNQLILAWILLLFSYLILLIALSVCLISMSVTNDPYHTKKVIRDWLLSHLPLWGQRKKMGQERDIYALFCVHIYNTFLWCDNNNYVKTCFSMTWPKRNTSPCLLIRQIAPTWSAFNKALFFPGVTMRFFPWYSLVPF